MFLFFTIIGFIGILILFFNGVSTSFSDPNIVTNLISIIITTTLCVKLMVMDNKIKDHETEIENLKNHLDIKHEDPVMNSYIQDLDNKKTGD